ncbi:c-type cytochrome [uncultured Paludibaculum sp.]|uniref:c-type cytochrome n=1 Tax=uncultured Paludibaculum sp. TaxID=1765020 RepID=UPI002AABE2BF|nr:c-type cytochrome [uncultured Paludibaculum sp.]
MKHAKTGAVLAVTAVSWAHLFAQAPPNRAGRSLPEGPGRDVTQRVCGSTCHGPDTIMGKGRSREQWTAVVNAMVARGAKANDAELVQIAEYLTARLGPNMVATVPPVGNTRGGGRAAGRGPGPLGAGAADSHVVDDAGAERGKAVYTAECITCHGLNGRGGNETLPAEQRGPDLVRSVLVLHDRYGSEIGPFLAKNHPLRSGRRGSSLTKEQVGDLAHFLHQTVYYTLRSGPMLKVQNVLTGDPKAGAAYFSGEGKCSTCHSASGDLAGIGKKYDPPTLQTKFLFPRSVGFGRAGARTATAKPVTVTVTAADGSVTEGVLERLDDFNVSLRDGQGQYRSFKITPQLKVVKHDPYAMHVTLLDQYTDKNIHDIVAYLESLQ